MEKRDVAEKNGVDPLKLAWQLSGLRRDLINADIFIMGNKLELV